MTFYTCTSEDRFPTREEVENEIADRDEEERTAHIAEVRTALIESVCEMFNEGVNIYEVSPGEAGDLAIMKDILGEEAPWIKYCVTGNGNLDLYNPY